MMIASFYIGVSKISTNLDAYAETSKKLFLSRVLWTSLMSRSEIESRDFDINIAFIGI